MKKIPQDIVGDIAILKFPRRTFWLIKKIKAYLFLKKNPMIKTVLEKTEGFSGELRKPKTKYLAGYKTKDATYKENECTFKFNVDETYFSPRLSNERKIIAEEVLKIIKKNSKSVTRNFPVNKSANEVRPLQVGGRGNRKISTPRILIMFAGVAPYPIVIAKKLKHAGIKAKIISNELNANANKYAEKNIALNKLSDYIQIVDGDARDLPKKLKNKNVLNFMDSKNSPQIYYQVHNIPERSYANMGWAGGKLDYKKIPKSPKFDIILMPRPQLKETFLKTALALSKKGTTIFYHGFGTKEEVLNEIKKDAGKKIGKIKIRKAGDISPHRYRWQAEFKVYN